jgi:hypothetical protein
MSEHCESLSSEMRVCMALLLCVCGRCSSRACVHRPFLRRKAPSGLADAYVNQLPDDDGSSAGTCFQCFGFYGHEVGLCFVMTWKSAILEA